MALDFTLLTENQIWHDRHGNRQLDVIKKYGVGAASTDLAVLLGSREASEKYPPIMTPERECVDYTWTSTPLSFSGTAFL